MAGTSPAMTKPTDSFILERLLNDRPCAIVLAPERVEEGTHVVVLPVTHSPPVASVVAIEIPRAIKR